MSTLFIFSSALFLAGFTAGVATLLVWSACAARSERDELRRLDNTERDERAFAE